MHKTRQVLTRPNKASDMNNKLYVSTSFETITGETNQDSNKKNAAKTYSTNMTLDVILTSTQWYQYIFTESESICWIHIHYR